MRTRKRHNDNRDGQQRFDWSYFDRKAWIEQAELPRGVANDGSGVSAAKMRQVLHCINDHLGNNADAWPGQKRIAELMDCEKRTVIRAVQALQRLSLMIVEQKPRSNGGHHNRYRIVWTELQLLEPNRRAKWLQVLRGDASGEHGDILTDHGDILTNHGDMVSPELITNNSKNNSKNHSLTESPVSSVRAANGGGPDSWEVVVSALKELGIVDCDGAARVAQQRGLTPADVQSLIERFAQLTAADPDATVGYLHRWITGKSRPPAKVQPQQRRTLTSESTRREMLRSRIVRQGRERGASEEAIERAIQRAMASV